LFIIIRAIPVDPLPLPPPVLKAAGRFPLKCGVWQNYYRKIDSGSLSVEQELQFPVKSLNISIHNRLSRFGCDMTPGFPGRRWMPAALLALGTLSLSACSPSSDTSSSITEYAQQARPDDPQLAEVYLRSCHTCHSDPASGAPLTGDTQRWAPLMDKGMQTLLGNVVNGIEGMPPYGLCMDCSAADFRSLIHFMAEAPQEY
jgi:cytochrome c5